MPITYANKDASASDGILNRWRVVDANEVKSVVNAHLSDVANPHSVTKTQVGLGSVDNTPDTAKPVSTAQQTALNLKAPLANPTFTGLVTVASLKLTGGTPGAGKVWTSDADGDGSWQDPVDNGSTLGWINVLDHGAIGDGTTDDTESIQAAFDAAPSRGIVYFPCGYNFKITDTITRSTTPINIRGGGSRYGGSTVTMTTNNKTAFSFTYAESSVLNEQDLASSIYHLAIRGPVGSQTSGDGVYSVASLLVNDVSIYGFYNGHRQGGGGYYSRFNNYQWHKCTNAGFHGTVNAYNFNYQFTGSRADNCGYGYYLVNSINDGQKLSIIGGETERHTIAGIYVDGFETVLIESVYLETYFDNTKNIMIGENYQCEDVKITSNRFTRHPDSTGVIHIWLGKVDKATISYNRLKGNPSGSDIVTTSDSTNVLLFQQTYETATFGSPAAIIAANSVKINGMIESRSGGFKFPDSTIQTTAALGFNISTLEFIVGDTDAPDDGDNTINHSSFINKKVFVYRNGGRQSLNTTAGIGFDSSTGTVTFYPVLALNDKIVIDAINQDNWTGLSLDSGILHNSQFTGTNGTSVTTGYTPDEGNSWIHVDGPDFLIGSNAAVSQYTGGDDAARMITTLTSFIQEYRITVVATKTDINYGTQVMFRAVDVNNGFLIVIGNTGATLYNVTGGTPSTPIAFEPDGAVTDTSQHTYEITLIGDTVYLYVDATLVFNAVPLTGTMHTGNKVALTMAYGSFNSCVVDIP